MSGERNFILSVDIGGSSCKIGRVAADGDVSDVKFVPTVEVRSGGVEEFVSLLAPYLEQHAIDGIAIGLPATIDWDNNYVRSRCPQVPWLAEAENKRYIEDKLHRPVLLANDVEALLVGEWIWGELKGMDSGVVISLGESMGSAFLWNSTPQQGRRGSIMELQHVSLETGGEVIDEQPPGSSSLWLSGGGLRYQMEKKTKIIDMADFFVTAEQPYKRMKEKFEDKLAHLLGTVVMTLDPERILLTGGLTAAHNSWLPAVKEKMEDYVMEQFKGLPTVMLGRLRGEEVVKGPAAFWKWKK
ncbi:MAG: ROK family protein [bacterium]